MKNEKQKNTVRDWMSYPWDLNPNFPPLPTLDHQCILENAAEVERSVREVIKRPRYIQWREKMDMILFTHLGITTGAAGQHYRRQHGQ